MKNIYRVAFTGGPSGGKSTALKQVRAWLEELGYRVLVVPEAATILFTHGFQNKRDDNAHHTAIQTAIFGLVVSLELVFESMAQVEALKGDKDIVILYDRGVMDGKAFSSKYVWQSVMYYYDVKAEIDLKKRYDLVIQLESAATRVPQHYTTANNEARKETPNEAAEFDRKITAAWVGHPRFRYVKGHENFDAKIEETKAIIATYLLGIEAERKFLVDFVESTNIHNITSLIRQTYLNVEEGYQERVRRKTTEGVDEYTHAIKYHQDGYTHEDERPITEEQYLSFLERRDLRFKELVKTRYNFMWDGFYFDLDYYPNGLLVAEVEDTFGRDVTFPPFLTFRKEVTNDKNYSNINIAKNL